MTFESAWEDFKATVVELTIATIKRAEINGLKFDEQKLRSALGKETISRLSEEVRDLFVADQRLRAEFLAASEVCKNLAVHMDYEMLDRGIFASGQGSGVNRFPQVAEFLHSAAGILKIEIPNSRRGEEIQEKLLDSAAHLTIK